MSPEDLAAARALALDVIRRWRDRGCPEPEPLPPAAARDDGLARLRRGRRRVRPDDARGARPRRADSRAPERMRGRRGVPRRGHRVRHVRAARRDPAAAGGLPVRRGREERGAGRDLVREPLPRRPGRRRQPLLLLQLRARRPLDRVLLPAAGAARVLRAGADERGIREHVRFGTEATAATYDDATPTWTVDLDGGETLTARAVVCAVGQLNRPFVPDVPGEFAGPAFHTARWPDDVDLTGKDVVMVGAGATGFQVAPAIAEQVASLTVLQRTAQWMFPNPGYHDAVGPGVRLGDPAPAVLRALVPVPDAVAGLRHRARRREGRPRLGAAAAVGERGQRDGAD